MKKLGWRLLTAVLALCVPLGAFAEVTETARLLSPYLGAEGNVYLSVGFEVEELTPYGEETVNRMSGLLRHMTLEGTSRGEELLLSLCVDGQPQSSLRETYGAEGWQLTTDLLPNRVLTSRQSPLAALFPEESSRPFPFALSLGIAAAENGYEELAEAILPYSEEKKANYKVPGIGKAGWVRLAKLDGEQTAALMPLLLPIAAGGMDSEFLTQLESAVFSKGLTVALYSDAENGQPMALYMKGTGSFGEKDNRTLSYVWGFSREENGSRKDYYSLELLKTKGSANKYQVKCQQSISLEEEKLLYSSETEMERKQPGETYNFRQEEELSGLLGEAPALGGTITLTDRRSEGKTTQTLVTEYTPDLHFIKAQDGVDLTGSIACRVTKGKQQQAALKILLGANPLRQQLTETEEEVPVGEPDVILTIEGGSLSQNQDNVSEYLVGSPPLGLNVYEPPAQKVLVDLDSLSPEEMERLQEELFQYAAGYLLRVLPFVDSEDTLLLQDNLSPEDYELYVNQAEHPD